MKNLTSDEAKQIIKIVNDKTKPVWKKWIVHYEDLDYAFLGRGFEQVGFDCQPFVKNYLAKYGMADIRKVGKIFQNLNYAENKKYEPKFARGIDSDFYRKLKLGEAGKGGELFYKAVEAFNKSIKKKGAKFWMSLWCMLRSCYFLTHNYNSSIVEFVKHKLSIIYSKSISDEEFKKLSKTEWDNFLKKRPWKDLSGIGLTMFKYVFRDTPEFSFNSETFKLDSANKGFLKVTGMLDLLNGSLSEDQYVDLMKRINGGIDIRDINKSIYQFYAKDGGNLCKPPKSCDACIINPLCKKRY